MKSLLNIICSSKLKYSFLLLVLLVLYIFILSSQYVVTVSNHLQSNLFRLHVIANSDSNKDQDVKYKVRDNLIKYMDSLCEGVETKEEAINIAKEHLTDFYNIAKKTLEENGFNYDVSVEIGNYDFPTKNYGDISIPSGYYDALEVKLRKCRR